jgi:hypothetical protein
MNISRILAMLLLCVAASLVIGPARAAASATFQNDSMWISASGNLWIMCEVTNTGDVWLEYVKVTATLRDSASTIVDIIYGYTAVHYVSPAATVPLQMVEVDTAKSTQVQSYSLIVSFRETPPIQQKLALLNVADSKNAAGYLEVFGEVQNQADGPSAYTKVAGSFYDETGKLVYVGYTYTDPNEVPPGATYPFKLTVFSAERSSKITRYSLIAESMNSGYTSIPETPWPIVMLTAVLTLAIVAVRRKRTQLVS